MRNNSNQSGRATKRQALAILWIVLLVCAGYLVYSFISGQIYLGGKHGLGDTITRADEPVMYWAVFVIYGLVVVSIVWLVRKRGKISRARSKAQR